MTQGTKITGHCYCGAVQYEMGGQPSHVDVCHCENCRRITGGQAVAWAIFSKSDFRYTRGEPRTYRSETRAIWSFCATCGSTLNYQSPDRPLDIDVVLVTLDDPRQYVPRDDSNTEEKLPWVNLVSDAPAS